MQLGRCFAAVVRRLLRKAGLAPAEIRAIGSHGQTVRHLPGEPHSSLQIGDPNVIVQETGITTVADFRRRDMAAGGEGAPLVPAFHAAAFAGDRYRVVLNIGGIANLTLLEPGTAVRGFDTGPGNLLMDAWARRHGHGPMDKGGTWAAGGTICRELLALLLHDPYFRRPPPKSTGREYFNPAWLERGLQHLTQAPVPADVQATLCELTAASIAGAIRDHAGGAEEILLCGGGVHNRHLMARLAHHLRKHTICTTAALGLNPDLVEATAFAWLAQQTLTGRPGNLPTVTGARHAVVLGGIFGR